MKQYLDYVFKKEKKPINLEKIYSRIETLLQKEDDSFCELSAFQKAEIQKILKQGVEEYEYYKTPNDRYVSMLKTSYRKGRFHGNRNGEGYVSSILTYIDKDGKQIVKEEQYPLKRENCLGVIDGDYVLIDINDSKGRVKVEKILDRNLENITGIITRIGSKYFVTPLDKKKRQLTIALDGDYIEGQIVSVALCEKKDNNYYKGLVVHQFKHKDDPNEDALLEAFKCGMPEGFSKETLKQCDSIPNVVQLKDKQGRLDLTNVETFSIDGADTKDKDDCISLIHKDNGNILLIVSIADVPYYVPFNSPIDKDAFRKGTSYYFGGCVEPQLPRKLSNGICSLNDGVERLTKSIIIEFDKNGNVISRSLVPSVIFSRIGMTYEKVNDILDKGIIDNDYIPYISTLVEMKKLADLLHKKRIENGAIEFNRPELKFKHDLDGKAIDVGYRYQGTSENIIEEFMLAANVQVGEILAENGLPCIYRIHGTPNVDRLNSFLKLLNAVGLPFEFSAEEICEDKRILQLLTKHIQQSKDLKEVLSTNLIRCMSHAAYSTTNIGHYGTGFNTYCHYTSPIRRLADLAISRIIDDCYFENDDKKREKNIRKWEMIAQEFAIQASKMEIVEEDVEKSVYYMDAAVYLSSFIGNEFEGTIVSVSRRGLTVQLDNYLEGRIHIKSLPGEYLVDPDTFSLVSLDGGENFHLGDRLRMRLSSTDKDAKTVDFSYIEKIKQHLVDDYDNDYINNLKKKKRKKR